MYGTVKTDKTQKTADDDRVGRQLMDHATRKQLMLNKGGEKYIFRFSAGDENLLLDVLVEQAQNPRVSFDWFDAAVLSFKLTRSLIIQADSILGGKAPSMIQPVQE